IDANRYLNFEWEREEDFDTMGYKGFISQLTITLFEANHSSLRGLEEIRYQDVYFKYPLEPWSTFPHHLYEKPIITDIAGPYQLGDLPAGVFTKDHRHFKGQRAGLFFPSTNRRAFTSEIDELYQNVTYENILMEAAALAMTVRSIRFDDQGQVLPSNIVIIPQEQLDTKT